MDVLQYSHKARQEAVLCVIIEVTKLFDRDVVEATRGLSKHRIGVSTMYSILPFPQDSKSPVSGIYLIRNIENNDCYVGRSIDVEYRWKSHRRELRTGKHHSIIFQRAWNKYGQDAFEFLLIELVDITESRQKLAEREQYYLDTLKPKYNIQKNADTWRGMFFPAEIRAKMSNGHKGKVFTPEHRENMRLASIKAHKENPLLRKQQGEKLKGRVFSEETRQKMSIAGKGKKISAVARERMSIAQRKLHKTMSNEQKEKMRIGFIAANKRRASEEPTPEQIEQRRKQIEQQRERMKGFKHTEESKEKIRQSNTGRKLTQEQKDKISKVRTGTKASEATRAKLRLKVLSPEAREKIRQSSTGRKHTPEAIEKIRQWHTGQKASPETLEKMRLSKTGFVHTEESKEKIGNALRGKKYKKKAPITEEHRNNLRQSMLGKNHYEKTEEHRNKIRMTLLAKAKARKEIHQLKLFDVS